ncbi:MAG: 4-(cytidine 5'-diphospho)-2-C-methyl-D-erythritol kinase [Anaerofustis sp.]
MKKMEIKARAKINLGLDITSVRKDGYHNIKTVMQSVGLSDELTFRKSDEISISCDDESLECGPENIIYRCIEAIRVHADMPDAGLKVVLEKRIPMGAGLGGGSADGAATLVAFNELYELGYNEETLCRIGLTVGADIPFQIRGGCALCEGIGEIITPIETAHEYPCVIVKPDISISTKDAYVVMDQQPIYVRPNFEEIIEGLKQHNRETIQRGLVNVFEIYAQNLSDEIQDIKNLMYEQNTVATSMSGSGSAIFGIFETEEQAQSAYQFLSRIYDKVWLTEFRDASLETED